METHIIPIEVLSISTSFSSRHGYSVILKEIGGNRKMQMIVGATEAQNLAIAQQRIVTSRPTTHQFIHNILSEFGLILKYVVIHHSEEGVYYAHVVLEDCLGHTKLIDCRPSDALSLAMRMEKPMMIAAELLSEESSAHDLATPAPTNSKESLSLIETTRLKLLLKEAIDNEDFELAAEIQTELNKR